MALTTRRMQGRRREAGSEGSSIQIREAKDMNVIEGLSSETSLHRKAKSSDSGCWVNHTPMR